MRPDMPRWAISTPPSSRWMRMYLARRPRRSMRRPSMRPLRPKGSALRRSARLSASVATRRPSRRSARPRFTVSTSGSSGMASSGAPGGRRAILQHMAGGETSGETDFGYRRVKVEEKARLVRDVFDKVVDRYDLMNDLMSGGIHRLWKGELVARLNPRPGQTLLDVAGGTGDIAFRFLDRAGSGARAMVCDVNESMVRRGRDRAIDRGRLTGIEWLCGDAERLPVGDGSVDAYTIAFGLRNVTQVTAALAE